MDRERAVSELLALGFVAQSRDWALGKTVFVSHPRLGTRHADGGVTYDDALYLRFDGAACSVVEMSPPHGAMRHAPLVAWADVVAYLCRRFIEGGPPYDFG